MSNSEEKEDPQEVPDGMVRKTRRVRKRRRSSPKSSETAKEDANSLFAKAKELLIGMQEEDEDYGPIDVAEQVRRLKRKKEDERPLDDVWGTKRRSMSWLWIVLVATIVSVVAIVVGVTVWAADDDVTDPDLPGPTVAGPTVATFDPGEGPLGWFNASSVEVLDEVRRIIVAMNQAEEAEDLLGLVRDSPFRELNPISLDPLTSPMRTNSLSKFKWNQRVVYSPVISGAKERGYLEITGRREDLSPYAAFFVLQQDEVKLDWDATFGWSEMPLENLRDKKPQKPILLRCRVSKKPSFDQMFGDKNYSGYILAGEEPDNFLFGYVDLDSPRGKAMDRNLRLLLNYGSFVTEEPPKKNARATMRVGFRPSIGEEGIFEIVEYLHDGWVTP